MSIKKCDLKKFSFARKITRDIHEHEVLVSFESDFEAQLFREWIEDRGTKQFIEYVDDIYGLEN